MKSQTLRNLSGAVVALILTTLTTQAIVHAAPRPSFVAAAPPVHRATGGTDSLGPCAGPGNRVC
jgi:hypothetical protein